MPNDPFELSQYTTSFDKTDVFEPNALAFSELSVEFDRVVEQIIARQAAIGVGFNVPDIEFTTVESFDASTPASIISSIELFQQAVAEMVTGDIIDRYGRLSNCDVYIGFFHFSNGFPIVGLSQVLPNDGQVDWTEPPNSDDVASVIAFTQSVGDNLNEIIFALNVLRYIHGRMVLAYEFDDSCGDAPPPTPPPPTPPTPAPTPPTPAPTPPTPAPTPPTSAPTPPTPAPTPPTPAPTPPTPAPTPPTPAPTPPTPAPTPPTPAPTPPTPAPAPPPGPGPGPIGSPVPAPASNEISKFDARIRYGNSVNLGESFGIKEEVDGMSIDNI